ncbi:MAG: dienelactone hydrolase family protein [Pseudomonadota bacterium]|nr:dienelactone hydrolase family protein [Pseudomonadota bacterium]
MPDNRIATIGQRFARRHGMVLQVLCLCVLLLGTIPPARAEERVSFPSLDGEGSAPVVLTAFWFPVTAAPAPAVVLLHGCNGPYDKRGQLSKRMREYTALFNRAGYHVLIVDSLTPRYETEICTQRLGKRRITQANRRLDALGAVAYLAGRADVEAQRIGLVGWSNGASTVLAATNGRHRDVAAALTRPAFGVAFYPGCEADLRRGYEPVAQLLLLVGAADDWTPAAPCRALVGSSTDPKPEIEVYAGAYHDFDSDTPLRLRSDVPNGTKPGQGVHVGGNAAAWRASQVRLVAFLGQR